MTKEPLGIWLGRKNKGQKLVCMIEEGDSCCMGKGKQKHRVGEAVGPAGPTSLVQPGQVGVLMLHMATSGVL